PMYKPFFPDPAFGWTFIALLMALLSVAVYTDWRTMIVPKKLTLTMLPLGLAFNTLRGAWLGASGLDVWQLGVRGGLVGGLDGLLFALPGFAVGFGLFFLLWVLGTCGGGDVKLFAALGAWVGPYLCVWVLAWTVGIVFVLVFGYLLAGLFSGKLPVAR